MFLITHSRLQSPSLHPPHCLQCTHGGSFQDDDLIPHPATPTLASIQQPTFLIRHCQVKYPLPLQPTLNAQPALYFKQLKSLYEEEEEEEEEDIT